MSRALSLIERIQAWLDGSLARLIWSGIVFIVLIPPTLLLVALWSTHHIVVPIMVRTFPDPDPLDAVAYVLPVLIGVAGASFVGGICLEIRALWLFFARRHHQTRDA